MTYFDELDGDSSEYRAVLKAYQEKTFPPMRKNSSGVHGRRHGGVWRGIQHCGHGKSRV